MVIGKITDYLGTVVGIFITIWFYIRKQRYPKTVSYFPILEMAILNRDCLDFSFIKLMHDNNDVIDGNIYFVPKVGLQQFNINVLKIYL